MFYSGPGDTRWLQKAVKALFRARRLAWVKAFNAEYERGGDEAAANHAAWAVIRERWGRKMEPKEKAINLDALRSEITRRLPAAFPGVHIWPHDILDQYVIAIMPGDMGEFDDTIGETTYWKIGYTVTWKPVADDPNGLRGGRGYRLHPRAEWVRMLPTFVAVKAFDQPDGQTRWRRFRRAVSRIADGEWSRRLFSNQP